MNQGQIPKIFVDCDLNVDFDRIESHPSEKAVFRKIKRMMDGLALDDIFRKKYSDI